MLRLMMCFVLLMMGGLGAGCEGEKETKTSPPAAIDAGPAPAAAADTGTAPPTAKKTEKADAGDPQDKKAEGPGLLPSPDFTLRPPSLKVPESDKKKKMLGGSDDAKGDDQGKPKLLDVKLKKGE